VIGFEVELSVPTFWPGFGLEDDNLICSFLFSGFKYTDKAVGGDDDLSLFEIKPDISDYAVRVQDLLKALLEPLRLTSDPGSNPPVYSRPGTFDKIPVRITKLEYATFALDEVNPSVDAANIRLSAQAKAIRDNVKGILPAAQERVLPVPQPFLPFNEAMYAGIPANQIKALTKSNPNALGLLNKLKDAVHSRLAIQATAGIFPSKVPQLFEEAGTWQLDRSQTFGAAWGIAYPLICSHVNLIIDQVKKDAWGQENLRDKRFEQGFKGHLYLLCSYLVGQALTQTSLFENTTAKNAVPYHAKMNLGDFHKAMPKGNPFPISAHQPLKGMQSIEGGSNLAENIALLLCQPEWAKTNYWIGQLRNVKPRNDPTEQLIFSLPKDFVYNALTGKKVTTFINQRGLVVKSEHQAPDQSPVGESGELGVQLEFRRLGLETVDPDQLQDVFMEVAQKVRKLNATGPRLT